MTRPTREQVDGALLRAEELGDQWDRILAAEVRALREELASVNTQVKAVFTKEFKEELLYRTRECDRLHATIARVEALGSGTGYIMGDDTLIRLGDIRAALRGKP